MALRLNNEFLVELIKEILVFDSRFGGGSIGSEGKAFQLPF